MSSELILTGLLQGLVLAFVVYGIMIPFRFLNSPDLTSEGSYPMGGALCAVLLMNSVSPILSLILAGGIAGFLGVGTAIVHIRLGVNTLLAGIIMAAMAYSVNLRMMGKPNLPLFNYETLFVSETTLIKIIILSACLLVLVIPFLLFLYTESGLRMRAIGLNMAFSRQQGISASFYKILGMYLGGFYAGFGGALTVQMQNYVDIGMGVGIVIHALAGLIVGESIFGNNRIITQILSPLLGALIYQQIQGFALFVGFAPSDLKMLTGVVVILVIAISKRKL